MPLDGETRARLKEKVEEADLALALQTEDGKTPEWALANIELAEALTALAAEEEDRIAFPRYEQAINAYEHALEVYTAEDHLGEWGGTAVSFARTLRTYSLREGGHMSLLRLERARKLIENVIAALPKDQAQFDQAMLNVELGYIYRTFADTDRRDKRLDHLRNTVVSFESAARIFQNKERFDNWAVAVVGQATAWREIAQMEISEPLHALYRSADLLKSALNYYDRDAHPVDWMFSHFEYGRTFLQIASHSDGERRKDAASAAVDAMRIALKALSPQNAPELWLRLRTDLAVALSSLAQAGDPQNAAALLEEAAAIYKMAAAHYEEREDGIGAAVMHANFGKELLALANLTGGRESQAYRFQAIDALRKSISPLLEKERHNDWVSNLIELGTAFHAAANNDETKGRFALYEEAVEVYRQSLTRINSVKEPELAAKLQSWMGLALAYLGENDESETGLRYLKESELAFRLALKFYSNKKDSLDFIRLESNLGNLFYTLARRSDNEEGAIYSGHARKSMILAISHIDKDKTPGEWATAQANLALILKHSIERGFSSDFADDCDTALTAFREALGAQTHDSENLETIALRRNLAALLVRRAEETPSASALKNLEEALGLVTKIRDWAKDIGHNDIVDETEQEIINLQAAIELHRPRSFFRKLLHLF